MAINWDEVREKARARGKANEQYIQSIQRAAAPSSPKVTPSLPKAQPKPLPTFQSVLDEYNTSLPGIGRQVAKALPEARKQEISQGTQRFFEQAPVQAGFMQGVSLNNPVKSLESKLGTDIDTSQAEQSGFYKAGEIGGIMTQFALPYAGASKGIGALTAKALPNLGKFGQGVARSVATDIAVGLPLNVNYAFSKEGLQGASAAKSIGVNTAIDLITGGILEAVPLILKSGKKVASKADFDALPPVEKAEAMSELERLAYESNVRKGKIIPQGDTLYGNAFQPIAGELPAPQNVYSQSFNNAVTKNSFPQYLYRGMELAEMEDIANTGRIKSNGSYNFEHQKGLTIFSPDKQVATSYATDFAPTEIRKKFFDQGMPSYVVEIKNDPSLNMAIRKDASIDLSKEPISKHIGVNEWSTHSEIPHGYINSIEELLYDRPTGKIISKKYTGDEIKTLIPDYSPMEANYHQNRFVTDKNTGVDFYNVPNFDGSPSQYYISSKDQGMVIDSLSDEQFVKDYYQKRLGWSGEYIAKPETPSMYNAAKGQKEAPRTVTPGEVSGRFGRGIPQETPARGADLPAQPVLPKKGTEIPKEQPFAQSGLKSVGADVNLNKPKMKVSKVRANTIENSPMYSKAKKFMDSKDYEYEVISEKRSLAEAAQRLATGFEGEVKDLPNKANFDGVDLDTSMGIAEQYIKEAEASGDWSKVNQWSKLIQEKGTQGGQLIQAFAKYSRTPEGAVIKGQQTVDAAIRQIAKKNPKLLELTEQEVKDILEALKKKQAPTVKGYQKIADDIRKLSEEGKLTEEAIRELVRKKNGIPVLDDTDIKNIYEAMKEAENYPEGSYLRRAYQAKAEQIISNKVPKEFRDKFRALQRLSMMTNLRTLFTRNPIGNVILGTAENIKDIPGAAIDRLVSLKTGQRTTVGLPNLPAQAKGFKQGLSEWRQDIKLGVDTSPSRGQLELPRGKTFQDKGIGKALNFLDNILIRGLQLGDRPFYQAAFNSRIEELRKLGITGEEAEKAARLFALERVFQNDSALSKGLQAVRQGMNDMVGGFPLGDLLIPFAQTPANILDKLLDYSPAGLGKALFHLGTTAGKGTFDQKLFVDRLARTFTGAGISLLTYALMEKGLISGNLSDSNDVRNAQTLQGQQAYSIKIGDTWYSFDWAQPIAGIIAGTVDAIKAGADSDDIIQATSEGAVAGIDTVFNQSVLQGLANLMSGYSPAMGIARSLMSSTSQATPTGMGQIARIIDPIVRETYDPNPVVRQGKKMVARIPFASRTLPAKIDVAGRVVKQSQGRGVGARMWENLLSPGLRRDETHDPVNAELLRLQSQTGDNAVLLNTAPKIFTDDGKKYILTSDEYVTYQKTMGQEAYSKIQKLMNTPEYRRMSDDEKAKAIKDIHEEAIQKARYEFYDNRGLPVTLALDKDYQEKFRGLKGQMTDKRFYAAVTDMKGKSRDIEKVFAAEQRGRVPDRFFEAFKISEKSVEKARALKSAGLTVDQYTKAMDGVKDMESDKLPNGKSIDNSLSKKKKAYIDSAFPNASNEQLKLLYELAGVSKTVGHYRPRFE